MRAVPPTTIQRAALSIGEFAAQHGISKATVRRLIANHQLESYMIGGQWRIRADVAASIGRTADDELDAHIKRLVDAAPELTAAQRDRLAVLLADGGAQ
jgi:excisionase family DNA binding protein